MGDRNFTLRDEQLEAIICTLPDLTKDRFEVEVLVKDAAGFQSMAPVEMNLKDCLRHELGYAAQLATASDEIINSRLIPWKGKRKPASPAKLRNHYKNIAQKASQLERALFLDRKGRAPHWLIGDNFLSSLVRSFGVRGRPPPKHVPSGVLLWEVTNGLKALKVAAYCAAREKSKIVDSQRNYNSGKVTGHAFVSALIWFWVETLGLRKTYSGRPWPSVKEEEALGEKYLQEDSMQEEQEEAAGPEGAIIDFIETVIAATKGVDAVPRNTIHDWVKDHPASLSGN